MLKQIDIQDLQPGMVIVKVTAQNGPVKIKKSGLVTSLDMVQGLIEMGILQLEIDTDQTVEVTSTKVKKSPTQKMLENNKVSPTRIDDAMSEQFHRSLFLSSVQDIPSPWIFYTKRYMLAGLIVLGGLGLGWTMAHYSLIFELFATSENKAELAVMQTPQVVSDKVAAIQDEANANKPLLEQSTSESPSGPASNTASNQVTQLAPQNTETSQNQPVTEAQVVTPTQEPEPNISADLLQRFEQAISEVGVTPEDPPIALPNSQQDVPRIDQLPAWIMTRLPSMAFSAHMYASEASERWVRVNGSRMVEGDKIDGMIEIMRIEPQHVILNYSGQTFSMAALTDW